MTPSEELHQLIQSMNMSEKRYFKIYSSRHVIGKKNNYLRLFDAIGRQDSYNEAALKKNFEGETFIKHLPSEKNYLYHNVLDSLTFFYKEKTFLARYCNILIAIEILYNKGLFDQCKKLINRSKKEAYSLEKFSVLLLILRWETLIYIKDEEEKNLYRNFDEEIRILDIVRTQSAFMQLAFNIQIQVDKGNVSKALITESEKRVKQLYPKEKEKTSFWINYYFHSARGLLFSVKNNQQERFACYREIKKIMDEAPQFIKDLPLIYHTNYNNLVNGMFVLRKYDVAEGLIRKQRFFLQAHGIKNPIVQRINFLNTAENELYLHYKLGNVEEGLRVIKKVEAEVKKTKPSFSPVLYDLLFFMAVADLMAGNHSSAIKWLNRILNAGQDVYFRKELQLNTRLLYLIVLFESNDWLFENRLNATKRMLAQETAFKLQSDILEALRVIFEDNPTAKNKELLKKKISEIKKKQQRSNEELLNKTFDFLEWIEQKKAEGKGKWG
ncbi:MAG: hypothetical protein JWO09_1915 [Bacteroidetes bacterium]|nr:hypothetical protein [Bacteroidota bacterium]